VRDAIGAVGPARHVDATLAAQLGDGEDHRWSATLGGGALFDVGCYPVNLARWIFGAEPRRVAAFGELTGGGVDRRTAAVLDFGEARTAAVRGSLADAPFEHAVVHGALGRVEIEHPFIPGWTDTRVRVVRGSHEETFRVGGANHFLHQIEHFAELVADPKKGLDPAEDGVAKVAACAAIARAIRSGRAEETR
jgi:predicted dehydrogenase